MGGGVCRGLFINLWLNRVNRLELQSPLICALIVIFGSGLLINKSTYTGD